MTQFLCDHFYSKQTCKGFSRVSFFNLRHPPGFHATHIPKGNFECCTFRKMLPHIIVSLLDFIVFLGSLLTRNFYFFSIGFLHMILSESESNTKSRRSPVFRVTQFGQFAQPDVACYLKPKLATQISAVSSTVWEANSSFPRGRATEAAAARSPTAFQPQFFIPVCLQSVRAPTRV